MRIEVSYPQFTCAECEHVLELFAFGVRRYRLNILLSRFLVVLLLDQLDSRSYWSQLNNAIYCSISSPSSFSALFSLPFTSYEFYIMYKLFIFFSLLCCHRQDFFGRVKNKAGDMEKILKEKDKHGLLWYTEQFVFIVIFDFSDGIAWKEFFCCCCSWLRRIWNII